MRVRRTTTASLRGTTVGAALALLGAAAPAVAAPPNDAPSGAAAFSTITAPNGTPSDREATALLADASADPGVSGCLGPASFARTVWFRVESAATARRVKVEASGETSAAPDLAAFVQPPGATDTAPAVAEPQACDGPGSPIAAAGDGSSVVDLHVPAGHQVLIQAGRSAGADPVLLALSTSAIAQGSPPGDHARDAAAVGAGVTTVPLEGATLTEEDPAQPACPAAGSAWRRLDVAAGTYRLSTVGADTVTAFASLSGDGALGCANRSRGAAAITVRTGGAFWVRLGADRPDAGAATLAVDRLADPADPPPPTSASATCRDVTRPALRLVRGAGRLAKRERKLAGRATDKACGLKGRVRRVEVAVQRRVGKRCRAVGIAARGGKLRSCTKHTWLRTRGAASWSLTFRRSLPVGRYVLRVRARDAAGNLSRTTRVSFTVRSKKR